MPDAAFEARTTTKWKSEPTVQELLVCTVLGSVLFVITVNALKGWHTLELVFGDNVAYLQVATAIRHWDFRGIDIQHFMGYPYAIAAVSQAFHLPIDSSLLLVAGVASLVSTFLVARLFGTWVASYFAFANLEWWQLSFLGGSEPLAVALGLGGFWAFRRGHILWATLLASLATTVRPLMFFELAGIGIALLWQKRYSKFVGALALGLLIGTLYVWPLAHFFGDPLHTVHSYTSHDYGAAKISGPHGHLFGWPFHAIIVGTLLYPPPGRTLC